MNDFELYPEDEWGVPDHEGAAHGRPIEPWVPRMLRRLPTCQHWREPFDLRDGLTVFASSWFDRPRGAVDLGWADIGFYLDGSWTQCAVVSSPGFRPPFASKRRNRIVVYPWPDFGLPRDPRRFQRALRWLLEEAENGRRIEVGCAGGHGRTGTTLAGLLVIQGLDPRKAVRTVRRLYCDESVESERQVNLLHRLLR